MLGICLGAFFQFRHLGVDGNGWRWVWMAFMMLIVAAAVIIIIYLLLRPSEGHKVIGKKSQESPTDITKESPLDIAKRRYASGEITADEFDKMRRDLE